VSVPAARKDRRRSAHGAAGSRKYPAARSGGGPGAIVGESVVGRSKGEAGHRSEQREATRAPIPAYDAIERVQTIWVMLGPRCGRFSLRPFGSTPKERSWSLRCGAIGLRLSLGLALLVLMLRVIATMPAIGAKGLVAHLKRGGFVVMKSAQWAAGLDRRRRSG
jgi:hypothetical protein